QRLFLTSAQLRRERICFQGLRIEPKRRIGGSAAIVLMLISALFSLLPAPVQAQSGPLNYWPLDDASGSTQATDVAGGNTGACVNGGTLFTGGGSQPADCPTFGVPGQIGTAATFNGTSQLLRVNNTIPNSFTVAGWIKTIQDGG